MKKRFGSWLLGLILPAIFLTLWISLAESGRFSITQLPGPLSILDASRELFHRGELWWHIQTSLARVLLGFVIGASIGITLGSIVGLSRFAHRAIIPTVQAIRAVPSLAWVPLLIIWLGIDESPKLTLIGIGAFFPVFTTVVSGLQHVERSLVEVGRAYGLRNLRLIAGIYFPAAAPQIFAGLRLGLAQSWMFLVAAELIASSKGLGFLLMDNQGTGRTDIVMLAIILLALLGKFSDILIGLVERRALAWCR